MRDKSYTESTDRHNDDSDGQDFLSAVFIAEHTEEQPTQRADQERNREGGESRNHLDTGRC